MDEFATSLRPLAGGHSGETFLAEAAGERVAVRVYGPRSAPRGPLAPEIDAAVLELVRCLVPVPRVLEVRRGQPEADVPGLLVTELLPGERLDLLLPGLDTSTRAAVGARLGRLLGRLGHMVQPRPGLFTDRELTIGDLPGAADLPAWVEAHAAALGWEEDLLEGLRSVASDAQDLLDEDRRTCLVHSDMNPKNLLFDPVSLELTGVLDWEFAHAGSAYADLGNLLRFDRDPVFVDAVLAAYREFMPETPGDLLDRARAADLFALVELAARQGSGEVLVRARALLAAIAGSRDARAWP